MESLPSEPVMIPASDSFMSCDLSLLVSVIECCVMGRASTVQGERRAVQVDKCMQGLHLVRSFIRVGLETESSNGVYWC